MASEINVKGLAELNKFLEQMPLKVANNVLRGALRAGANVIKTEAQAQLTAHGNVKTGVLSAGLRVSTRNKGGLVAATLITKGKHGYVANWIEYGAAAHEIRPKGAKSLFFAGVFGKSVQHPGIKAKPFMRPALDMRAGAAVVAVGEYVKKRLATKHGLDTSDIEIEEGKA